jgi:hypothetical protein
LPFAEDLVNLMAARDYTASFSFSAFLHLHFIVYSMRGHVWELGPTRMRFEKPDALNSNPKDLIAE